MRLGELGLVIRADRADHRRAQRLQPLTGKQANATGGRVEQHRIARLDSVGTADQVLHRHAFQHERCRLLVADAIGNFDHAVGRHIAGLAVRANQSGVRNPIALLESAHAGAHRVDNPRSLVARHGGQLHRIQARALIGVDEIDADRGVPDADLPRSGFADVDVLKLQDVRSACLVKTHCFCHCCLLFLLSRLHVIPMTQCRCARRAGTAHYFDFDALPPACGFSGVCGCSMLCIARCRTVQGQSIACAAASAAPA